MLRSMSPSRTRTLAAAVAASLALAAGASAVLASDDATRVAAAPVDRDLHRLAAVRAGHRRFGLGIFGAEVVIAFVVVSHGGRIVERPPPR